MARVESLGGFALGLGRQMPGFEPGQPVPRRTDVSSVVHLTCILATDVCWDVQVYAHGL
jgi:hypothetical protein